MLILVSVPAEPQQSACTDIEREAYLHEISQAVTAAWKVPIRHRSISCRVLLKQNFRGEVLDVGIARCGKDPVVRKSVVDAAYRASPVPLPANDACFDRDIIIDIHARAQGGG